MIRRRGNRPNLPSVKEVLNVYWVRHDKGILKLYCLLHACPSKMSVFRCLRDLSVQIVRRSTLNRLEVHFRVQGPTKLVQIQKVP